MKFNRFWVIIALLFNKKIYVWDEYGGYCFRPALFKATNGLLDIETGEIDRLRDGQVRSERFQEVTILEAFPKGSQ